MQMKKKAHLQCKEDSLSVLSEGGVGLEKSHYLVVTIIFRITFPKEMVGSTASVSMRVLKTSAATPASGVCHLQALLRQDSTTLGEGPSMLL